MSHQETRISRETIYEGKIITLHRDKVELENGNTTYREVVHHMGGVATLAVVDGQLLLVRQYRYATGQELLELPAGKLEPGEDPAECAARELEEETGYRPAKVHKIGAFYASPGYDDEMLHLYRAEDLTPTAQHLDDDEFVSVVRMPPEEALAACLDGRIIDAKTALAITLAGRQGWC